MNEPDINLKTNKELMAELEMLRQKLHKALDNTINVISRTCEIRDPYTAEHQGRVTQLSLAIAEEMGLPHQQKEALRVASLIHDIGKISVPTEILSKTGLLSQTELNIVKMHVQVSYEIIRTIEFTLPVADIVLQHHERLDGSGYPLGAAGNTITLEAKILGVADVVEAMSSHHPYRPALGVAKALEEITVNKGVLYDSGVVDACLKVFNEKGFQFKE